MQRVKFLLAVVPLIWVLSGCANPADDVPAATVGPASDTTKVEPAEPADDSGQYFAFGPDSATIGFTGSKVTGSHNGGFEKFAGEFYVVDGRPASGTKVVIDTNSLWSDNEKLTDHLKSPDFFDASQYPTASFVLTAVDQQQGNTTLTGDLTLHGVTKTISFPAAVQVTTEKVNLTSEFSINRFDFNMQYPGKADDLIRKEVVIRLDVNAVPGRADFGSIEPAASPST